MTALEQRGSGFRSLTASIDTTTSAGKLIFHIFGALAEFERDLIRERCTDSQEGRKLNRSFDEEYREQARQRQTTPAYAKAMRKRAVWVEPLFGEAKEWHGLRRVRLRGLWKVNCEGLLIAAGQNLKRWLSTTGWGRRHGACGRLVALPIWPPSQSVPLSERIPSWG